jgi:hypothetical protein
MTLAQVAVSAAADMKWLLNSSAILRRRILYTAADSRWWGLVRVLTESLQLPLNYAARAATASLSGERGAKVQVGADPSHSASLQVDLARYRSVFLGNLSRALEHETPKRRGRPAGRTVGGPIAAARRYGIDLGLLRSALERTPAERLAILEANAAFVRGMRRA